jgi:hypothetical protein
MQSIRVSDMLVEFGVYLCRVQLDVWQYYIVTSSHSKAARSGFKGLAKREIQKRG